MTNVLISTSIRHTPVNKPSGRLLVYNLESDSIIRRCEIIEPPYREENPNPRGGLRGLKGISIKNDVIAVANASTIFLYDPNWNPITYFFHPSCAGIHDILLENENIWVTSSRNDLLINLDFSGKPILFYDSRTFKTILNNPHWQPKSFLSRQQFLKGDLDFRDPRTHDEVFADSSHLNAVTKLQNGDLLISCGLLKNPNHLRLLYVKNWMIKNRTWYQFEKVNRFMRKYAKKKRHKHSGELVIQPVHGLSVIFRISPTGKVNHCLTLNGSSAPSHSVRALADGTAIYLDTTNGQVVHLDPTSGEILSKTTVGQNFLRGARQLPDGTLLLGDNNKVIHFDLQKREIISSTTVSDDNAEAIFDFFILPDHYGLPPQSFVDHHNKLMPVIQI